LIAHGAELKVNEWAPKDLYESLIYRLSYHGLVDQGYPHTLEYDVLRKEKVKKFAENEVELKGFKQVFSSKRHIVRIYKVE
jgi:hypothetical protein